MPQHAEPVAIECKHWGAHYFRARLSDGSTVELKSRVPLTLAQWQARATAYEAAQTPEPEPEPELICPGWDLCPFRKEHEPEPVPIPKGKL